jgi:hypothetical protein
MLLLLPTNSTLYDRAFQTFGAFTSGIGVHYAPSVIVNTTHQSYAANLIIGQRMLPHVFIRAADARPFEIQDLLPADTRFKVIVFAGDTSNAQQLERVRKLAADLQTDRSFFKRFGGSDPAKVFDVLSICSANKDKVNYTDLPPVFRSHWSKYVLPLMEVNVIEPTLRITGFYLTTLTCSRVLGGRGMRLMASINSGAWWWLSAQTAMLA